jgi:hypothetical protein
MIKKIIFLFFNFVIIPFFISASDSRQEWAENSSRINIAIIDVKKTTQYYPFTVFAHTVLDIKKELAKAYDVSPKRQVLYAVCRSPQRLHVRREITENEEEIKILMAQYNTLQFEIRKRD